MKFPQALLSKGYWFQEGPGVRNWQFTSSGIKLLNVANIVKDGSIDLSKTDRHLSVEEVEEKYSHFLVDSGDLVIASSGITTDDDGFLRTRGAFIEKHHLPLCMNTSTIRFKALDGVTDLRYLRQWLQSFEFRSQISREVTGIAQKNFGPSHLKKLKIALPPLAEQKRIAAILDSADALRVKRRESLAQLDILLQSIFLDMFGDPMTNPKGWEELELASLIEADDKINYGVVQPGNDHPDGKPLIRVGDFTSGELDTSNLKYIDPEIEKKYRRSRLTGREILVSCVTAGVIGTVCKVPCEVKGFNIARAVARIPLKENVDRDFMLYCLRTEAVRRYFVKETRAVAQPTLNIGLIKTAPVFLPPFGLQQRFATIVESVEQQKVRLREHLTELDTLFASLQQRAFNGDL